MSGRGGGRGHRWVRMLIAGMLAAGCSNAGADRVLTIPGVAQVRGLIFLDQDGDTAFSNGDGPAKLVKIQLIARGTVDTLGRATSDTITAFAGNPVNFAILGVPVGSYRVAVDTLTIPHDSMLITHIDSAVTLAPGDTGFVRIAVGFPQVTIPAARALPIKTKVWIVGVALANANTWGDSTNSFADPSGLGAMRVIRIKPTTFVALGDSDRVLGTVDTLQGQRVFRFVTLFTRQTSAATPTSTLTVGQAKTANGGAADAGLVILSSRLMILDTLSGPAGRILHVKDTTASLIDTLEVHLDTAAQFDTLAAKRDTVGGRMHLKGILFPSAVPGRWLLKPRSPADQTP